MRTDIGLIMNLSVIQHDIYEWQMLMLKRISWQYGGWVRRDLPYVTANELF
jgi:hypothetical protein